MYGVSDKWYDRTTVVEAKRLPWAIAPFGACINYSSQGAIIPTFNYF